MPQLLYLTAISHCFASFRLELWLIAKIRWFDYRVAIIWAGSDLLPVPGRAAVIASAWGPCGPRIVA